MRDSHIRAIEKKIERIKFYKIIGQIVIAAILIIALILIFSSLNTVLMMQTDTLNILNDLSNENTQEVSTIQNDEKVAVIERYDPKTRVPNIENRELVERVVAAEARGESLEGMMAVAQTIRDRAEYWQMTPKEVVTAPSQYASPYEGEISESVKTAVSNVFDNGVSIMQEPTTHFHANYVNPYWTSDKACRGSIGAHKFYY